MRKCLIMIWLAGLVLCGCKKESPFKPIQAPEKPVVEAVGGEYVLMSYNVGVFNKHFESLGHYSYPEVASVISSVKADVCGLNETDWGRARSENQHQAELLASSLGSNWGYRFVHAIDGNYGNSMVWKKDLEKVWEYPRVEIPKTDGSEVRSMFAVEFRDFVYCVTHLDHKSVADRRNGLAKITSWVEAELGKLSKPVFLCGDFNDIPSGESLSSLSSNWKMLSPNQFTFPASSPKKCIDYILVYGNEAGKRVKYLGGGVVTGAVNPTVQQASDHCPVWVRVKIE